MLGTDVGRVPKGWIVTTLDQVCDVNGGIQKQAKRRPVDNKFPFLRVANVGRGTLDLSEIHEVELFDGEIERFRLKAGDLLVVEGNGSPDQIGRAATWKGAIPDAVHQNHLIRVRPSAAIDSKFLELLWNSPLVASQLMSVAQSSSGLYTLSTAKLKRVQLALPPLAEQHRIVEALEELLSRLDAAVASTYSSRQRLPGLIGALRNTGIGSAKGRELPSGWRWGTLGQVLERIEAGKSFRCEARPALPHEWGVIKVSAMTWGEFREGEQKAAPVGRVIDERHEVRSGDILVSRANTPKYVGAPVIVGDIRKKLLLSDKSLRLVPAEGVDKRWLISVLSSPYVRRQISAQATGSKDSMRNISQRQLLEVEIPIAPKREQAGIAASVTASVDRAAVLRSELDRTLRRGEFLKSKVLKRAFMGKLLPQDPSDEPATTLLTRIAAERDTSKPARKADKRAARPRKATAAAAVTKAAPAPTPAPSASVQQELFDQ
ncbi:restriction endonuclease subunit S [Streptomyces sp. NPDC005562]|uniref:restriction endonuclease subunit S n=1 Tax=Streptomyces sp. NPDC005562 TaxID=3154890 RepID=UPI00339E745B